MPASDMMLTVTPKRYIGMNARSTDTGMVTMGTIADGMCQRKIRMTSETMIISMRSSCRSVCMARVMRSERS